MPLTEDLVHIGILSLMDVTAIIGNLLLIAAVIFRTPKVLNSYSVLVLNMALVDVVAATLSLSTVTRLRSIDGTLFVIFVGPCKIAGARFCHLMLSFNVALCAQSCVSLIIAFSFRLWMLSRASNQPPPQIRGRMWLLVLCSSAPSIIALFLFYSAAVFGLQLPEQHPSDLQPGSAAVFSAFNLTATGELGVQNYLGRVAIGYLSAIYLIGFISVLVLHRELVNHIRDNHSPDRPRHQMILNSLTAQMFLPLGMVGGSAAGTLESLGILNSALLQRSPYVMSSVFAFGSPLINLYCLAPYRRFTTDLLRQNCTKNRIKQQLTDIEMQAKV